VNARAATPSPPVRATFSQWALAIAATSTMTVSYIDRQTLAVVSPTLTRTLGIHESSLGLVHASFALAYLVGAPMAGRLIDRFGARRGLLGAVLVWSAVSAAHALVPGLAALFAIRFALGLAEAPSFPGAVQTVQRALPPADRATGFGVLFTGSSVGAMIVPPIATWLVSRYDFRAAFIGTAIVGLAWLPMWLVVAWQNPGRARIDAPSATDADAPAAPRGAAAFREPGEVDPPAAKVSFLALVRTPAVLRLWLVVVASAPFLTLLISWSAMYLVNDLGLAQKDIGFLLMPPPLLFDVGAIGFGALASRAARRTGRGTVPPYLLCTAAAMLCVGALMPLTHAPAQAIALASVAMAGGAGMYVLGLVDATARAPKGAVATVGGLGASAQSVAQIVVNPLIGFLAQATGHYTVALVALALWAIPGTVVWTLWQPETARA
jgi:MFS family permease